MQRHEGKQAPSFAARMLEAFKQDQQHQTPALLDPTDFPDWRHGDFKENRMQYKGILIPHPTKVTVLNK